MNWDELSQTAEDVSVVKHPLAARNLTSDVKAAYLGLVSLALFLDDNQLSSEEKRQLRSLGCSLEISIEDIWEIQENVLSLAKDDAGQLNFIREMTPLLKECAVAMFAYYDMAKLLLKSGEFSDNAKKFLSAIKKFFGLSSTEIAVLDECTLDLKKSKETNAIEIIKSFQKNGMLFSDKNVPHCTPNVNTTILQNHKQIHNNIAGVTPIKCPRCHSCEVDLLESNDERNLYKCTVCYNKFIKFISKEELSHSPKVCDCSIKCPRCQSTDVIMGEKKLGKSSYKCKVCSFSFKR